MGNDYRGGSAPGSVEKTDWVPKEGPFGSLLSYARELEKIATDVSNDLRSRVVNLVGAEPEVSNTRDPMKDTQKRPLLEDITHALDGVRTALNSIQYQLGRL